LYPEGSRQSITTGVIKVSTDKFDSFKTVPWHPSFELQPGNDIQRATTKFTFIKNAPLASLVCCEPITGRKHQLRMHATALNSQILGDCKFGQERKFKDWIQFNKVTPLHLHSSVMWINNWYGNGNHLSVFASPPQFFTDSLGKAKLKMPILTYVNGEVQIEYP
jgi:23S rRNA-/tRNA-specific pseudouridylate synthase